MRITRDNLIKLAHDAAKQRIKVSRRIVCIYLTGSCLTEDPLLGGTTDIDLVIVQDGEPVQPREVVRLTDEIHLDISHYAQEHFSQPRHLRTDPWLGPFIYSKPMLLHDTAHWFDYTQASTGAKFLQPDNVMIRARSLAQQARQAWMELTFSPPPDHRRKLYGFLKAVENAGNAVASLTGAPLAERRFLLQINQRAQALGRADLSAGLVELLAGEAEVSDDVWNGWLKNWEKALDALAQQENCPVRLQPTRKTYYERAASALWAENPAAAFWLLMRTWTLAVYHLPTDSPAILPWQEACQACGLDRGHFGERLEGLDHYLDAVEETLDQWGQKNGVVGEAES
jgi:hypothetical protein